MSEQQAAPPVHLYREHGLTLAERILCRALGDPLRTHVTEYGNRVTCAACLALMRAEAPWDDEARPNPWAEGRDA